MLNRSEGVTMRSVGSIRYQNGAETVEFAVTLLFFFIVFFMIIDFAIAMYDRGTMVNAARDGSRQGSLYWVDPVLFDPLTPLQNQRLKRSMVDTVVTWNENLLIDPGGSGLTADLQINMTSMTGATAIVTTNDLVSVGINYPHQYIGLTGLLGVSGLTLTTQSAQGIE